MRKIRDFFAKLPQTSFYFLVVAVLLGEAIALWNLFPWEVGQIQKLLAQKQEVGAAVTSLNSALVVLRGVDQKQLARQVAVTDAALPFGKKTSGLVAGIRNVASASGVTLQALEFSPGLISTDSAEVIVDVPVPGTTVHRVDATVTLNADLSHLVTFLTKIYTSSQLIGVAEIDYSGSTVRQQIAQVAFKVYYQPKSEDPIDWKKVRPVSADEAKVLQSLSSQDVFILPEERR